MFSSEPILRFPNRFEPTDQRAVSNITYLSGRRVPKFFTHGTPVKSPARSRLCRMWGLVARACTPPRRRRLGIRGSSACDPPSMVDTRSSPRVGHMRASPSSARTPAQPVRRAACAHNASPQSPAARASLVARVGAGAASPARRRRVLSKRRARAPLPPSASWYPFPRNAQCAYPGIGPHRSIGFLVGEPRRSVRILVKMYTGFSV